MRIETQKQTLAAREESIKKLMEMLQNKGMSMYTLCISLIFFVSSFCQFIILKYFIIKFRLIFNDTAILKFQHV